MEVFREGSQLVNEKKKLLIQKKYANPPRNKVPFGSKLGGSIDVFSSDERMEEDVSALNHIPFT